MLRFPCDKNYIISITVELLNNKFSSRVICAELKSTNLLNATCVWNIKDSSRWWGRCECRENVFNKENFKVSPPKSDVLHSLRISQMLAFAPFWMQRWTLLRDGFPKYSRTHVTIIITVAWWFLMRCCLTTRRLKQIKKSLIFVLIAFLKKSQCFCKWGF